MSKIRYAQSSDIKKRTWDEYRHDMKTKAIVELECLPLLRDLLVARYPSTRVSVRKFGPDAVLWFNPGAALSGKPDYEASWSDGRVRYFELQKSSEANLKQFDFKMPKVRWRKKGEEGPYTDRELFYVAGPERKMGFLEPAWIMANGTVGTVKAWGGAQAFRVPRDRFLPMLDDGGERLDRVVTSMADRVTLLEFQKNFPQNEGLRLFNRLKRVVDKGDPFEIVPGTLDAFFETCFLAKRLNRFPEDPGLWLVYLCSLIEDGQSPARLARGLFAIDYLYFRAFETNGALRGNEERSILSLLQKVEEQIRAYSWDGGSVDPRWAPIEELRQMLFVVNRFEDWRQHVFSRYPTERRPAGVRRAERIFDLVPDVAAVARRIREAETPSLFAGTRAQ